MIAKLLKILFVLVGVAILAAVGIVSIAQTPWFKARLENQLYTLARENGFSLKIGHLKGSVPLRWELDDIQLTSQNGLSVEIDHLRFRIAFFPLIQREVGISYLRANKITVASGNETAKEPIEKLVFETLTQFPVDFFVRSFRIDSFSLIDPVRPLPPITLKGTVKIKHLAQSLLLKLTIRTKDDNVEQEIFASGGTRKGFFEVRLKNRIVSLAPLQGIFPQPYEARLQSQIDLRGPIATWQALALKKPSPSSPLSGKLFARIDNLTIPGYEVLDIPWKARCNFQVHADRSFEIEKGGFHSSFATLNLKDVFYGKDIPFRGEYSLEVPDLEPLSKIAEYHLSGALQSSGNFTKKTFDAQLSIQKGQCGELKFSILNGTANMAKSDSLWLGNMKLAIQEKSLCLEGSSKLELSSGKTLKLTDLVFTGPAFALGGDLVFDEKNRVLEGTVRLQTSDLSELDPFFPSCSLGGMIGAELQFLNQSGQSLSLHAKSTNLQMKHLQIADAVLDADLHLLSSKPLGTFDLRAERIYLPNVYLASMNLHLAAESSLWRFAAETEGTWKEPFQVTTKGTYVASEGVTSLRFDEFQGNFLNHSLKLEQPSSIEFSEYAFTLSEISLQLGQGRLTGKCSLMQDHWQLFLQGNDVPIAWLTLFTPYLGLEGETTIVCALQGNPEKVQGSCQLTLRDLKAKRFGTQPLFQAKGSLLAHFEGQRVQIHSELQATESQVVLFDASVPLSLAKLPQFPVRIDTDAPWSSSLLLEGKMEEFSEFLNTGFHGWKGWLEGKMLFSGSLNTPQMKGNLTIHQGAYENDFLGLHLENIEANIEAIRDELLITSLDATGYKNKGTLKATGNIRLRSDHLFPYRFSFAADHLRTISLDILKATVTGPLEIEGNSKQAIARGILNVDEAYFSVPRSLPADIPDLPVTFINQPEHVEQAFTRVAFPFHFDINFHSDDSISFDTSGLTSRWGGDLHIHGVNSDLLANGTLRLVRGQFSLLGKTFQLHQGEISFSDKPGQEGLLSVSGTLNLNDVTITAQLRGTLTAPQLTMQSVPPLTTSDIFSLILFNKKVAEIKPMQAVTLARTVISLSGSAGWNFVGQIGSGLNVLGIDTFDIIPSEEGLNQTSITIGKHFYLVRGVLISLTQSLTSRCVTVEVDLGKGVLFQAENQSGETQSQQVGKFSLKWNKNY